VFLFRWDSHWSGIGLVDHIRSLQIFDDAERIGQNGDAFAQPLQLGNLGKKKRVRKIEQAQKSLSEPLEFLGGDSRSCKMTAKMI
jgi:hypothetical protein